MANDQTQIWNAKREALERRVTAAVMDLFAHVGAAAAFVAPLDPNTPGLIIAAGPRNDVKALLNRE